MDPPFAVFTGLAFTALAVAAVAGGAADIAGEVLEPQALAAGFAAEH
jgi:hypothetical protein